MRAEKILCIRRKTYYIDVKPYILLDEVEFEITLDFKLQIRENE